MIQSDKIVPKDQIAEIWCDMFLTWAESETRDDTFAKRPPEEPAIILKHLFDYLVVALDWAIASPTTLSLRSPLTQ